MDENKITLTLKKINKYYPSPKSKHAVHALSDIDLEFVPGWYGITGNNGAGKSTLFQILTGYLKPDSGQILINGSVVNTRSKDYKKMLGYMPQQQMLYESMTCLQFMNYIGSLKGLKGKGIKEQVELFLKKTHLQEKKNVRISALSGGMKQRLLFAQSCLGYPDLILLDEPTAGVDPNERENIQNIIKELCEGRIVIMSTHILSDIEKLVKKEIHLSEGIVVENRDIV